MERCATGQKLEAMYQTIIANLALQFSGDHQNELALAWLAQAMTCQKSIRDHLPKCDQCDQVVAAEFAKRMTMAREPVAHFV